jgi:hypothetical protein
MAAFSSCEFKRSNVANFYPRSADSQSFGDQEIDACFCWLKMACMFSGEKNSVTGTV